MQTHFLDGSVQETSFEEIFKEKAKGFTLRFVKSDQDLKSVIKEEEIIVSELTKDGQHVNHADLYFSKDGKYFMIYLKQLFELRIFEVKNNDFKQLQKDVRDGNTIHVINRFKVNGKVRFMKFMEKIIFDQNNRYFAAKGRNKVAIFSYEKLK